jgi:MFS family permease
VQFVESEFDLSSLQLGWVVSCLTLTATLAMMTAGPLSDRVGRRAVLFLAAALYAVSAILSAVAPSYGLLVIARMIGGLGVGASLIIAPMYIAELSPPDVRGRMVSFNQLNIVVGISAAFLTNYLIVRLSAGDAAWAESLAANNWRWMLGLETLPAVLYFGALFVVPESPRWLAMRGRGDEALTVMTRALGDGEARLQMRSVEESLAAPSEGPRAPLRELFRPAMRLVLTIGLLVAILQQITGINSVFFYAPMIFEQSGIGTDAAFLQAVLVGITNLVFTVLAIGGIDRFGRKPLLLVGTAGIAICMCVLAYGFGSATFRLAPDALEGLPEAVDVTALSGVVGETYESDVEYKAALAAAIGDEALRDAEGELIKRAISMNAMLVLIGVLGFVASFAMSLGPVMWVLFSELFPNRIRGLAISFVGFANSGVSFLVQLVFPWELDTLGSSMTFLIYGVLALAGGLFLAVVLPETKGRSLEELERSLVR